MEAVEDVVNARVDAAVHAEGEAVAGGADCLDHGIDAVRAIADDVEDGAEHLALEPAQPVDLESGGREEGAVLGARAEGRLVEELRLALHARGMGLERGPGVGVDHWPHVGLEQGGIADHQLLHRSRQHIDEAGGDILLHEHNAQGRAALARALEGRGHHVRDHLLGQGRGIDDHGVLAAGLGDQRGDRPLARGQGLVDEAGCLGRAGEGHARDTGVGD